MSVPFLIFAQLTDIYKIEIPEELFNLPPREEFREGCRRYESELYDSDLP